MKEVVGEKVGECTRQEALAQQAREELFQDVLGFSLPTGSSSQDFLTDSLLFPRLELSGPIGLRQAKTELKSRLSETALNSETVSPATPLEKALPAYSAADILAIKPEALPRNLIFRSAGKDLDLVEQLKELKTAYESKYDASLGYIAEMKPGEAKLAVVLQTAGQAQAVSEIFDPTSPGKKGSNVKSESEVLGDCLKEKELQFQREFWGLNKEADQAQVDDKKMSLLYHLPPNLDQEQKEAIRAARTHGLDENLPPEIIQMNVDFRTRKEWSRVLEMPPDSSLAEIRETQAAILEAAQQGLSAEDAASRKNEILLQQHAKYAGIENPEAFSPEVIEATYNSLVQIDLTQDMNLPNGTKWEAVMARAERLQMQLNPDLPEQEYLKIRKARLLQVPDDIPDQTLQELVHQAEAQRAKIFGSCFVGKEGSVLPYNKIAW